MGRNENKIPKITGERVGEKDSGFECRKRKEEKVAERSGNEDDEPGSMKQRQR